MRRKDDEKPMGPMFPRLHVNDTETGGPRAPPRNKMALYEQLSIPSQRFNSGVSPLKPNSNNHVLPPSPSQFPPSAPKSHLEKLSKSGSSTLSRVTSLQHNASAEDDFAVPIFIDSTLVHCLVTPTVSNNTSLSKRIQRDNGNDPSVDRRSQTAIEPSKIMSCSGLGERCPESLPEVDGFDEASEKIKSYKAARLQSENVSRDFGPEETLSSRENDMGPPSIQIDPSSGETQCINDGEYLSDERSNDGSYASNVDAISAVDISPDDAVGIIGQKHFRKARKAIVNQQRVFAVQVFELHRLITVQRLIAASPNLLLEDALAVTKPPSRTTSPAETVAALEDSDNSPASPSIIVKQHPTRQSHPAEFSAENAVRKPMTAANRSMTHGTAPPPDTWTGPWGEGPNSAPSPNQWLVPMMSPTEGLVYKACPSPMFGSCATSALMGSNFPNPQLGGVLSYPPQPFFLGGFLHSYFPPYGSKPPMMPIPVPPKQGGSERLNSSQPASTVLTGETNHAPTQREAAAAAAASAGSKRIRISRESDFQGSISDSPFKKVKAGLDQPNHDQQNQSSCDSDHGFGADRDDGSKSGVVSLFLDGDCTSRVIKAVPHNPKSASESVARIFKFIQKERKQ